MDDVSRYRQKQTAIGKIVLAALPICLLAASVFGCSSSGTIAKGDGGNDSWSAGMECTQCHTAEAASSEDQTCLASKHAGNGINCTDCHKTEQVESIHADVKTGDKVPSTLSKEYSVEESVCLSCHGSLEQLAAKSTKISALTDADGTTINPHSLPSNSDHSAITCTSCHSIHVASGDPKTICLSCHHENVFQCHTCHD